MTKKKNIVVVGATGSLGKSVVEALENAGYFVDSEWTKTTHPDATKFESYKNLPDKIYAAIYLAGLNFIHDAYNLDEDDWDKVLDVNLKGAFLFFKAAYPSLLKSGQSNIIAISSIMTTHPYPQRLPYVVAKAGLEGMIKALAVEWGNKGISTHAIRLGHLEGLMKSTVTNPKLLDAVRSKTPSSELVKANSVATYILWLLSGGCASVSGSVIDFDPSYCLNRWPL